MQRDEEQGREEPRRSVERSIHYLWMAFLSFFFSSDCQLSVPLVLCNLRCLLKFLLNACQIFAYVEGSYTFKMRTKQTPFFGFLARNGSREALKEGKKKGGGKTSKALRETQVQGGGGDGGGGRGGAFS